MPLLRHITPDELCAARREPFDAETLAGAEAIMRDVRERGWSAALDHARRLGDLPPGEAAFFEPADLRRALEALGPQDRGVLERTAARIETFARAQRACLAPLDFAIPGGRAGHTLAPVERAGCYAPGGRYPLPSSVLMTALTARAAGVREVWAASPRPAPITLAAAALAGCDGLLAIGGAQAVGVLAYGAGPVPACDLIAGPGNVWVTAAKHIASRTRGIDMLAGPSEVLIIADASADPALIAADLLAQAEHDDDARPVLITTDPSLHARVEAELERQLATLPTAPTARAALRNGFVTLARDTTHAAQLSDAIAPEHLELHTRDADDLARRVNHYGSVFIGSRAAEVLGDYGAGPNHVLPTGGIARACGGLSVLTFLRVRTFLSIEAPVPELIADAAALGRAEGLEAHARAAEARLEG